MAVRVLLLFLLVLLLVPRGARAEGAPERTVFALIVTNNKSQKLARPDLHYADDDGAKYHALFRTLAPEANVTLLTAFDRDTAKLFPDLDGKVAPPEKARVISAFATTAQRVRESVAKGARVDFYFVFAGHGDVDEGKGFVELADGKLVSDELTSLVASVPATRSHVILDSCNSFFVLNARKPGGRRFVTAAEAGERLNKTLPTVGVFLSTSAEAETFEWSELGAGIFSHAVRSGLSGAADANGDGDVSYEELAAFVHTAAKDVKNPRYRPSVFARGPSGHGSEALVSLKKANAVKLRVPVDKTRVTVRDADDLPWIDAHLEGDREIELVVPERIVKGASVELPGSERQALERTADGLVLAASQPLKLASRGQADLFKSLFMRPFGPRAFAQYEDEVTNEPPPVYGVASDDVKRMRELLWHASATARSDRKLQGLALTSVGVLYAGLGGYLIARNESREETLLGATAAAVGAVPLTFGAWSFLRSSREERAYEWFEDARARNAPDFMVTAEAKLFALARRDREERLFWRWFGIGAGIYTVGTYATFAVAASRLESRSGEAVTFGMAAFVAAAAFTIPIVGTFTPTSTERLAEIWANDPSRVRLDPESLKPKSDFSIRAGLGGVSGTF